VFDDSRCHNANDLREIFRLVDWMMRLPEDLSRTFEQALAALEESLNMPYVTSVERIAEERGETRGRAEGRAEGGSQVLLKLLAKVRGPLPAEVEYRVRRLSLQDLEALTEAVLDFRSVLDVEVWLESREGSTS